MRSLPFRWMIAASLLAVASPAAAGRIAVGSFCIEGVQEQAHENETTTVGNGVWRFKSYCDVPGSAPGSVVIFDRFIVQNQNEIPTCAAIKAQAQAQGARILLEGTIRDLSLKVGHFASGGQNSYVIAPNALDLDIGHVTSGFSTIGGGRMDLAGSRAWIKNPGRLNINPTGMTGTLRIESWRRKLTGASFRLEGGATAVATLEAPTVGNTMIDVDTATGAAALRNAALEARDVRIEGRLDGELAQIDDAALSAGHLLLSVINGRASLSLADAAGTAEEVRMGTQGISGRVVQPTVAWSRGEAEATQSPDAFSSGPLRYTALSVAGSAGTLAADARQIVSGRVSARFERLANNAIDGRIDFSDPAAPTLDFLLPAGSISTFGASLSGTRDALAASGTIKGSRLMLGGVNLVAPASLRFVKSGAGTEIRLPVELHLGPIAGGFTLADANQSARMTAALRRLDLEGTIIVDLANLDSSRLEVATGKLNLSLDSSAAVTPLIAGIKPTLAQAGVVARNRTPLVIRRAGSTGQIDFDTPLLALGQPVFRIGSAGTAARVAFDLQARGVSTLRYDLQRSSLRLAAADFEIRDADVAAIDPGFAVDLGGFVIREPRLRIGRLALNLARDESVGRVAGADLSIGGSSIASAADGATDVRVEGRIASPFSIARLDGEFEAGEQEVSLRSLTLASASFAVGGAKLRLGEGARLDDASVSIAAAEVKSVTGAQAEAAGTSGLFFRDLLVKADGKLGLSGNFTLQTNPRLSGLRLLLNGRSDRLNGDGSAHLDGFLGKLESELDTSFTCSGGSRLSVPIAAQLATGPSELGLVAHDGDFSAEGSFAGFGMTMASTQARQCSSPSRRHVIQEEKMGSMTGWCPTFSDPGRTCTWKTVIVPEISVTYEIKLNVLALTATVLMANPRVRLSKKTQFLCNAGPMALVAPVFVGGYYPQLSNPTVLNDVLNVVIEGLAITVESAIATGLLNFAAGTINILANDPMLMPAASTACVMKGSW